MSMRKLLIGLAIFIMLAGIAILLIKPGQGDKFDVYWRPISLLGLCVVGSTLAIYFYIRASDKKMERIRAEQLAREEEQRMAEEARLRALPKLINCPACNKEISRVAVACPSCGHPINPVQVPVASQETPKRSWSPGVAALLSLIIPGAGQMYKGQVGAGLLWLIFVVGGYFLFIIPGVILHLVCIFSAASEK
jgi:hypothetical protein